MSTAPSRTGAAEKKLPRAFHIFWAGQGLSALGDAMTIVALPLVVLAESGSIAQMGRLTAFSRVGGLMATAAAGFLVDSQGPRRVMIVCDALRCLLMASIPLAAAFRVQSTGLLYVVGVGAALAQGLFLVGHVSLVAGLVGRRRVSRANSRIEGTIALAYVFGPLTAGLLSARWGAANVLAIDALSFLASGLSLCLMGPLVVEPREPGAPASARAPLGLRGLRFIGAQPELWRLTILVALWQFFNAAIVDLFIFRLKHELNRGDSGTGITFAVASALSVLAAAMTPWLRARASFHAIWGSTLVLQAIALLVSRQLPSFAVLTAAAALYMAAMTTMVICQASLRQELTPQHLLGRVTSSFFVMITLPAPLGAFLATTLAARFGAANVHAGIGVGLLATVVLAMALWARMTKTVL